MAIFTSIGTTVATSVLGAAAVGTTAFTMVAGATAFSLQLVAGLALSSLGSALSGKNNKTATSGVRLSLVAGADTPRSFMEGIGATAGSLVYANEWGQDGDTPNAFSVQVIALSDLPVKGLSGVWFNDSMATLGGVAHASRGYPVLECRDSKGQDHLWVKFYDGTQTTADDYLVNTVGSTERPYSSSRVGRGIAYAIVTSLLDDQLMSSIPSMRFILDGVRYYDPSKDTTVGGSGSQRLSDPSTWGGDGDYLPAVHIYNKMVGIRYAGKWVYGLQNATALQLPTSDWINAIQACRDEIEGPDGYEPTYRAGGEVLVNTDVANAIEDDLKSCNGRMAEAGGTYRLVVGPPSSAVKSISDGVIISTAEQKFTPFISLMDSVTAVTATYPNPDSGYQQAVAPMLIMEDMEPRLRGRRQFASIALPRVPYPAQVQRLMKWALSESLKERRHVVVLPPEYGVLQPGDVIEWTSARNGYSEKKFRVDGVSLQPNLDVMVDITEVDDADYSWDQETDYRIPVDGPVDRVLPEPQPMAGFAVSPYAFPGSDGSPRRPGILLEYTGGMVDTRSVLYEVMEGFGDGNVVAVGEIIYDTVNVSASQPIDGIWILPATPYQVRARFLPPDGSPRVTEWSTWLSVTTLDIRLTAADISIEFDEIADEIASSLDWIKNGVRSALEAFKQLGTIIEEADRENYNQRQMLARQIAVEMGDLRASFDEVIEVALGPGGALATALSSLYAAMGGNSAEVNVRWEAVAAPSGYAARYAIQAAVDDGTFRSATFYLDVPADPDEPTRIVLVGDQVVIANEDGTVLKPALVVEDGEIKFAGARAGKITDATGEEMWIDFDNKEIYMKG